ncbi:MAG TPA: dTMP kinase [Patescibacteria group bacterium]|nr:dTMP kinase [Patescibacteria group bacterium]
MAKGGRTSGLFITFEGGEGSGKTTQIKLLADKLKAEGNDVVTTREPGGTSEAEKIRSLLVNRDGGDWTPVAEVLLLFAARSMHVENLIKPALAAGKTVICDRFTDSTRAYQSYGHGLPIETVESINTMTLNGFEPHMTFILDLPVEAGLARAGKRLAQDASKEDRFEKLKTDFHERLRQGYLDIAKKNPRRCMVINADQSVEAVAAAIHSRLQKAAA